MILLTENSHKEIYKIHGSITLWGMDIPRVHQKDKIPRERPMGPIIRKVTPSWAWGGTSSKAD
jgi:hypothetical protein